MRVLVGGVGYPSLRDESLGPWVVERLGGRAGAGAGADDGVEVEVEDVSYHAVGLAQNLQEREPYDRMVLVGAVRRGREPGTIARYRWNGALPDRDGIQERVAEAVTGVVSIDIALVVCKALGGLPEDVRVVEVEPGPEGWGEGFSAPVRARLDEVLEAVWSSTAP